MIQNADTTALRTAAFAEPLMFISGYVYRILRAEARKLGIRGTGLMVLKDLDVLGPSTPSILAEIEQVRRPTMTVLLRQLEGRGTVRRSASADRRSFTLELTAKGRKDLHAAGGKLRQRLERELKMLQLSHIEPLTLGLTEVATALKNLAQQPVSRDET